MPTVLKKEDRREEIEEIQKQTSGQTKFGGTCGNQDTRGDKGENHNKERERTEDRFLHKLYPFSGIGIKSPLRNVSGRKGFISRFLRI